MSSGRLVSISYLPGLNFVWADREGNIGWQVAGIAPVRKNWSGLVPVPGDGRYEWSGYLPVLSICQISIIRLKVLGNSQ